MQRWAVIFQQKVDLINLFQDVARGYVAMASVPSQYGIWIDRGFRGIDGRMLGLRFPHRGQFWLVTLEKLFS